METLFFAKVKEEAIIPSKNDEDMGYDVYACIEDDYVEILPGEIKLIPTGIASAISEDYGILIRERGSTGSKGMSVRAGVIDSSYRGEWFIGLNNTTNKPIILAKYPEDFQDDGFTIYPVEKAIAQAVVVPVPKLKVKEIPLKELQAMETERGDGKLGSSEK